MLQHLKIPEKSYVRRRRQRSITSSHAAVTPRGAATPTVDMLQLLLLRLLLINSRSITKQQLEQEHKELKLELLWHICAGFAYEKILERSKRSSKANGSNNLQRASLLLLLLQLHYMSASARELSEGWRRRRGEDEQARAAFPLPNEPISALLFILLPAFPVLFPSLPPLLPSFPFLFLLLPSFLVVFVVNFVYGCDTLAKLR